MNRLPMQYKIWVKKTSEALHAEVDVGYAFCVALLVEMGAVDEATLVDRLLSRFRNKPHEEIPGPVPAVVEPAKTANAVDASELDMYIRNDYGLYRQRIVPIRQNLLKKMQMGRYNHSLAVNLWMYLVDAGAQQYAKVYALDAPWNMVFPKPVRVQVARGMANEFLERVQDGDITPEDHQVVLKGALPDWRDRL